MAGGRRSRMAQSDQQQQSAAQAEAGHKKLQDDFKQGMSVCLGARGYTVK